MQRYFLGIEVARGGGVALSQQIYVLILTKTGMLGCKPTASPIDPKIKLTKLTGEKVDLESYQISVDRLIYKWDMFVSWPV